MIAGGVWRPLVRATPALRLLLAGLFLWAAALKLSHPRAFAQVVDEYGIVVCCGFPKCGRSHNGAVWAKQLGYTGVVRYIGGIKAWDEAGYPVEKARE